MDTDTPTFARLEDQIAWYERRSRHCQWWFKGFATVELITAASLPVIAVVARSEWLLGVASALVIVAAGLQQVNQFQHNWQSYRSTCEALKHEKFLFLGGAAPYASVQDSQALLAERVETLVSREHAQWCDAVRRSRKEAQSSSESLR